MEQEKTKKALKRNFFEEGMAVEDGAILETAITESEIQEWAQSNFGRKLTDIELNRIQELWFEAEGAVDARYDLLDAVIKDAINNQNNQWEEIDKEYIKGKE